MLPEIRADFRLIGNEISPDEITRLLGIQPTKTWFADDIIQKSKMRRKENGWVLENFISEQTYEVTDHLIPLLKILLPKARLITEVCDRYNIYAEFSIAVYVVDETPSIHIDKTLVSAFEELRTAVDIDIILTAE